MTIELRTPPSKSEPYNRLKQIACKLETQSTVYIQLDDSKDDYELMSLIEDEVGYSCLKMISESEHCHYIINTDFPNLELKV